MRKLAFDITHLASRLPVDTPTGIDKVDLAFAQFFSRTGCDAVVHYGFLRPRFHRPELLDRLVAAGLSRWSRADTGGNGAFARVYRALTGRNPDFDARVGAADHKSAGGDAARSRRLAQLRWRSSPGFAGMPRDALYLNVAQHAFEYPRFFRWLDERPDVKTVFLVHDLLPLDYPEYFRSGYKDRFEQRTRTILERASAIITTSHAVKDRLRREFARRQRPCVAIHVEPLPSQLPTAMSVPVEDPHLREQPYFVILGTIEPRKNHLLLLNVWRRIAEETAHPPRLVIVGNRGWENEQVVDILERSTLVKPHVIECSGLDDVGLVRLLANSRGLLMPSFAEGYGLPIVEALTLGVPVVATDIAVFNEVAQGRAVMRHPTDGPGWQSAIEQLADVGTPLARSAREMAQGFRAPQWPAYFEGVTRFLASL
ncbi:MAG: glycosyltransferase family 4 protein [Alphaproteobacteria bacterium]|nr:glycosyltransferase family 4 protein [Alphaproteobacteria bacterium]